MFNKDRIKNIQNYSDKQFTLDAFGGLETFAISDSLWEELPESESEKNWRTNYKALSHD